MKSTRESGHQGIQTCHLCGKVQCGQRLGRVKCCLCSRIFCLQQLQRKFGITAIANDPEFKCPRCTGICCCVCNCQKPPPHVHCKVYKVRQNKGKPAEPVPQPPINQNREIMMGNKELLNPEPNRDVLYSHLKQEPMVKQEMIPQLPVNPVPVVPHILDTMRTPVPIIDTAHVPRIPSCAGIDSFQNSFHDDCYKSNLDFSRWEQYSSLQDTQNSWQFGTPDAPGSMIICFVDNDSSKQ